MELDVGIGEELFSCMACFGDNTYMLVAGGGRLYDDE
jgi:hypothetical protein